MPANHELDTMFKPGSVAVVGVSSSNVRFGGTSFLRRLIKLGFPGKLFPVNPKITEFDGLKAYPDIRSLPEAPDLVIISVPGKGVPRILRDCITRGVKNVHIFSSGFYETGLEEGKQLDKEITDIIQNSNLNVVGPNCMGLYVPSSKLTYWGDAPMGVGPVAFISQSGGHAEMLSEYAQVLGVYFSKMISFGNARGLQAVDFLEYLGQDPDTKIIVIYLEGIVHGNRFTQLVREVNKTKPVIVWKGGLTESGSRAISSHTGSLAGEGRIWDAFFKQTGAVRVNSREEIVDMVLTFLHLKPPKGYRTLVIGGGGGNTVAIADICSNEGLEVPRLSEKTRKELNTFIPLAGHSARNPIDAWMLQQDVNLMQRAMELAISDPSIDVAILDRFVGHEFDDNAEQAERMKKVNNFIIDFASNNSAGKPLVISMNAHLNRPENAAVAAKFWTKCTMAGVPTYLSQENAARALSRFIRYHEFQAKNDADDA